MPSEPNHPRDNPEFRKIREAMGRLEGFSRIDAERLDDVSAEDLIRHLDHAASAATARRALHRLKLQIVRSAKSRRRSAAAAIHHLLGRTAEWWKASGASVIEVDAQGEQLNIRVAYRCKKTTWMMAAESSHPLVEAAISGRTTPKCKLAIGQVRTGKPDSRSLLVEPLLVDKRKNRLRVRWLLMLESSEPDTFAAANGMQDQLQRQRLELAYLLEAYDGIRADSVTPCPFLPSRDGWTSDAMLTRFCHQGARALGRDWAVSTLYVDQLRQKIFALGTSGYDYELLADEMLPAEKSHSFNNVFQQPPGQPVLDRPLGSLSEYFTKAKAKLMGLKEVWSATIESEHASQLKMGVLQALCFADLPTHQHADDHFVVAMAELASMLWDRFLTQRSRLARHFLKWKLAYAEASARDASNSQTVDIKPFALLSVVQTVMSADAGSILCSIGSGSAIELVCSSGLSASTANRSHSADSPTAKDSANKPSLLEWLVFNPQTVVRLHSVLNVSKDAEWGPRLDLGDYDHARERSELLPNPTEDRRLLAMSLLIEDQRIMIVRVVRSKTSPPFTFEDQQLFANLVRLAAKLHCFTPPR